MLYLRKVILSTVVSMLVLPFGSVLADVMVDTKYGKVTIKDNVERVVTLNENALDVMSAIHFPVVGAVATRGSDSVSYYLAERQSNVPIVGTAHETNIEAVIKARPDVILAHNVLSKDQYEILSKIAPTVVPKWRFNEVDAWRNEARLFGKVVGHSIDIEQVLDDIDIRATDLKKQIERKIPADERKVVVARWMPQGPIVMAKDFFAGGILVQAGFEPHDGGLIIEGRPHSNILSLENIEAIDQDWLFMATLNKDGDEAYSAAKESAAFSRLNVVRNGHVQMVDGQAWSSTSGPLAAQKVLDDIEQLLENLP